MNDPILIAIGTALATAFGSRVFYQRKHKAEAVGAEKGNDRTEIENYKLIATEWREAAQKWKDLADEYQLKLIENSRKIEVLVAEHAATKKELLKFKNLLAKANRRIAELERQEHGNQ